MYLNLDSQVFSNGTQAKIFWAGGENFCPSSVRRPFAILPLFSARPRGARSRSSSVLQLFSIK